MSVDLSTLKLVVDGTQGTAALQRYDAAAQKADRSSRLLDDATAKLTKAFGLLGGAAALLKIQQIADQYTTLNARLALSARSATELATAQQRLFTVAQNTRQPLADVVGLYARLSLSAGELGVSQDRLIRFTDGVNKALVVSGSNATQASGALLQLSQAIGGGIVRAEEFNSIIEGTPRVLQAVAQGFEGGALSVAQLRQRVIEGQVTSQQFFEAFERGAQRIDAEFAKIPTTVSGALTQLANVFGKLVSDTDKATAGTAILVQAIQVLTKALPALTTAAVAVGAAFGVRFLGNAVTQLREFTTGLAKSRAETLAYAEDSVRTAAAQRAASARRLQELQAEQVAIRAAAAAERERLATANARVARAVPVESLAPLGGRVAERDNAQVVFALKAQADAQRQLTALQTQGIAVNGALAAEKAALAAATAGVTAATTAQAAATSLATRAAELGKAALAALGGAMGLITFGVGLLLVKVMGDLAKAQQEAADKAQRFKAAVQDLSNTGRIAALQTELALQQRINAEIPRTVGGVADLTKAETFAAQVALDASKQRVQALRDVIAVQDEATRKQAAAAPGELAKAYEAATAKLAIFRQQGALAAEAFDLANGKFADTSKQARTLAQALGQGDAAAKQLFAEALKVVTAQDRLTKSTEAATKAQQEAKEIVEKRKALEAEYAGQWVTLSIELTERAATAEAERTAALRDAATATATLLVTGRQRVESLQAEVTALKQGNIAAIEFYNQQQLQALVTERLNEAKAAGVALTPQVIGAIVGEATQTQRLLKLREALAQWDGKSPFKFDDGTKSVRDLDSALSSVSGTLRDISQALNGTGNDAVRMLGVLASALDGLAKAQQRAREMAKSGQSLSGSQRVAAGVGGAVGAFGSGFAVGSQTTSRALGVLGGAAAGAATGAAAGSVVPGVGTLIGAGVGALIGGIGGLLGASKNATQQLIAQRAAQEQLNQALVALRASFGNDALAGQIAQAAAQFSQLRQQTEAAFSGRKNEAERNKILAELNVLEAKRIELIRAEFAEQQQRLLQDFEVRRLRAEGFTAEAEALAFTAQQERELADLRKAGADAATIAAAQEAQLAESRRRQAEAAEAERRTLFDLNNGVRGFTDPRGASQAAFDEEQQRRYTDAVSRGASAAELAAIKLFNLAEAADRAAQIAEQDRRTREGLTVRGLSALGNTRGAEDAALAAQQRQEFADAIRAGMSPSNLALLQFVQFAERERVALQRAIEDGTKAIQEAAAKQIAAIDAQIAAEQARAAEEVAAIDAQIAAIRSAAADATGGIDAEIATLQRALDEQVTVIDAQLDVLGDLLTTQRAQLQTAEAALTVARNAYEALNTFGRSLFESEAAGSSPLDRLAAASARFDELRALAEGGDANTALALPEAARTLLEASKAVNASGTGFQTDFARVQQAVAALAGQFGADVQRLNPQVEQLRALVSGTERQIETLQTLRDTLRETTAQQVEILQAQRTALVDAATQQIATLEQTKQGIQFASEVLIEVLEAQREQVQRDAERQIEELVKIETAAFQARIEASEYYRAWQDATSNASDRDTTYQDTTTSLMASVEQRAQESAAELRAQSASLRTLIESQAQQITVLQAQVRVTAAAGSQTVSELAQIRAVLQESAAAERRTGEALLA